MKKSLVLAMAMALGVTASAYAANPFSDVPAGHWAYDSIDKLAAAGVIEGMGDGTYQGDRNMTRYEMAQIVAKAMAKGANVDKLAAEFADELDNLGVRVAALEKKADNVTITGQIRYDYGQVKAAAHKHTVEQNRIRTRLFLNGQINDKWAYHARLQNDQKLNNNANEDGLNLNRAYVTGRIGGLAVDMGRTSLAVGASEVYDDTVEAIKVAYGKNVKLEGAIGQTYGSYWADKLAVAKISTKMGKATVAAEYAHFDMDDETKPGIDGKVESNLDIWDLQLAMPLSKSLKTNAQYYHANTANHKDGVCVGLNYKGASAAKPGSWGIWAKYMNMGEGMILDNGNFKSGIWTEGVNGMQYGVTYTLAKNMVASFDYNNFKTQKANNDDVKKEVFWTRVQFTF